MESLLKKNDTIKSKRTNKTLLCYSIMSVFVGENIITYNYSFYNPQNKKFKTLKQSKVKEMLSGVWELI